MALRVEHGGDERARDGEEHEQDEQRPDRHDDRSDGRVAGEPPAPSERPRETDREGSQREHCADPEGGTVHAGDETLRESPGKTQRRGDPQCERCVEPGACERCCHRDDQRRERDGRREVRPYLGRPGDDKRKRVCGAVRTPREEYQRAEPERRDDGRDNVAPPCERNGTETAPARTWPLRSPVQCAGARKRAALLRQRVDLLVPPGEQARALGGGAILREVVVNELDLGKLRRERRHGRVLV